MRAPRLLIPGIALAAAWCLSVSGSASQPPQQDTPPELTIGTEIVLVNVVASSGSGFVSGLTASDFEVTEDGVPQKIEFFGAERTPFAAAILLDRSGSMERKLQLARVAAARFMDHARPDDRVAVYLFGSDVDLLQDFTPGGRDLSDGLWDSTAEGITKMYDCVAAASGSLATRAEPRRALLLISDGADFGSASSYDNALRLALAAGVSVYSVDLAPIGATHALSSQEELRARGILRGFAERSGGRFYASKGGQDLNDAFASIIDELTNQYTIGYAPSNTHHDGTWRKIGVTTARPGLKLRARTGYQAPSK